MLEVFIAVARKSSFSAAARDLYLSQSHVSGQIRRLEASFGVPLFYRTQPRVSLTDGGVALLEHASELFERIADMEYAMDDFRQLRNGTVRVGAVDSAGNFLLPRVIADFNRQWPHVTVEVRIGNTRQVRAWLESGQIEISVCPQPVENAAFVSRPCFREDLVIIQPASWNLPSPLDLATFARTPKVLREEGSYTLSVVRDLLAGRADHASVAAQLTGNTAVAEAVAAEVGVALIPRSSARPWVAAGSVTICELAGVVLHNDFSLLYRADSRLSRAADAFIGAFPSGQLSPRSLVPTVFPVEEPLPLPASA